MISKESGKNDRKNGSSRFHAYVVESKKTSDNSICGFVFPTTKFFWAVFLDKFDFVVDLLSKRAILGTFFVTSRSTHEFF